MTEPDDQETPDDPLLAEEIEAAIQPYLHLLSAQQLAQARVVLADAFTTHPVLSPMLDQLRDDPQVLESGETAKDGCDAGSDDPEGTTGAGGAAG